MIDVNSTFYIVLMKTDDHIAVLANREDGSIAAKQHSHEWVQQFEDQYNRAHVRSYESSMSACINGIMMRPSIVQVNGLDDIKQRILDEKTAQLMSFRNIAGGFQGIISKTDLEKVWDEGINPRLISA